MINLIFFLPKFSHEGAGNSTFRLCKNLNKKKYKINIISLGKNSYKKDLENIGCRVYEIKHTRVFRSMFVILPLVKRIYDKSMNKNIFISAHHHTNVFSIIFLRKLRKLKIIVIERSDISELLIFNNIKDYIKNKIIYLLVKICYKKANLIISNSKSGKKDLTQICNAKVINIPSPSFIKKTKKKLLNKIDILKLIAVGRLSKEKGNKIIIEALSKLKMKNFSMKILGSGPEKKDLLMMIKRYKLEKKIKLIGFKKNTKKYYQEANLFINASFFEGFPNAVVEAISYCVPVICSNCKGGAKEILLNGKGGEFFKSGNPKDLSEKIFLFYKNPKFLNNKLRFARKNIHNFSIKNHVNRYESVFRNI
jgi:glycosyltransferase involved in cell wall biosynthesis